MELERRRKFREAVDARRALLMPGAFNALSARVVADQGFEALYLTGAGLTNMYFGLPDQGFMGLHELAQHTTLIRDCVDLPLLVDADTGFGNALNVRQAVRLLERAGADAIQLEDQVSPKRCGHFTGKEVVGTEEMVSKIRAAVDARQDPNLLIVARTDARAVEGFDAAMARAARYSAAGADVLFVEALESREEIDRAYGMLDKPQLMNFVIGGKTPLLSREELSLRGYGIVLYANAALQGALIGMERALGALKAAGRLDEDSGLVMPFQGRQRLVGKPFYDELERKYAPHKG